MGVNGLNYFFFYIVDLAGQAITTGLKVTIRTAAGAVATIYTDEAKTAKTNPITGTITRGKVEFWYGGSDVDVEIIDSDGNRLYRDLVTVTDHRIIFDVSGREFELVGANIALGAELVDTAATFVDFPNSVTINGAELAAGDVIRIRGQVRCADFNSGDTLDVKLLVGTEAIFSTGDLTIAANGDLVNFEADVTVDVIGASGKLSAMGSYITKLNATVAIQPFYLAQASEDISGSVVVKVQGDYSAEHEDNEAYLTHLNVQVLKKRTE